MVHHQRPSLYPSTIGTSNKKKKSHHRFFGRGRRSCESGRSLKQKSIATVAVTYTTGKYYQNKREREPSTDHARSPWVGKKIVRSIAAKMSRGLSTEKIEDIVAGAFPIDDDDDTRIKHQTKWLIYKKKMCVAVGLTTCILFGGVSRRSGPVDFHFLLGRKEKKRGKVRQMLTWQRENSVYINHWNSD